MACWPHSSSLPWLCPSGHLSSVGWCAGQLVAVIAVGQPVAVMVVTTAIANAMAVTNATHL